ncbi:MAG: hypothetical protein MZW92_23470, partial [Comamonadaceae bacterium]|nr:hypothetical protein [Comamonadaceae bacterium]
RRRTAALGHQPGCGVRAAALAGRAAEGGGRQRGAQAMSAAARWAGGCATRPCCRLHWRWR